MRAGEEGRVADQRDPPERDARRREIVNRGEEQTRHCAQRGEKLRRQYPLALLANGVDEVVADERRRYRYGMHLSAGVGERVCQPCFVPAVLPTPLEPPGARPQVVPGTWD